jgi:hypothetical protein
LTSDFISLSFSPFLLEEREGVIRFQLRERVAIWKDFDHQNSWFLCQKIPYNKGVTFRFFLFTLKTSKKTDLSSERIFVLGGFWGGLLSFWVKNKGPCFSYHHHDWILGYAHDKSSANIGDALFFYILGVDDASSSPSNLKQKNHARGPLLYWARCWTWLARLSSTWPNFFIFIF